MKRKILIALWWAFSIYVAVQFLRLMNFTTLANGVASLILAGLGWAVCGQGILHMYHCVIPDDDDES